MKPEVLIGGVPILFESISFEQRPRLLPLMLKASFPSISFNVNISKADTEAFRSLFAPSPNRSKLMLTTTLRDGTTHTEQVEVDELRFVITRRGKRRPGQWGDRARKRRRMRLARAASRREGISRRGLVHGFPWRTLGQIHAETRARLVESDARFLEQALNEVMK